MCSWPAASCSTEYFGAAEVFTSFSGIDQPAELSPLTHVPDQRLNVWKPPVFKDAQEGVEESGIAP